MDLKMKRLRRHNFGENITLLPIFPNPNLNHNSEPKPYCLTLKTQHMIGNT